ncbi:hypothetical protein O2N63_01435 [Aliiroseovarius sp. KMU-50]|uniref:Uncharacterized protein n=1 Tax=Aliiroseovarius salicola TaxID=3009082 RepID=A0ABT4VYU5_9RHOB|nr:hypothetical protein [Aliiroseovarius sp. KMU-50]MDA5092747.1 hypothetical protein [Aliiroseovarius sp. KMU-50]
MEHTDTKEMEALVQFLRKERAKVTNFRAFKARLRNYGYCIRREAGELTIHSLPSREMICPVPRELLG